MATHDPYPPLITARSPSYERAWRELLHPSPTGDPNVVALLGELSEAEDNAGRACAKASTLLKDETLAKQLREHADAHQARRHSLSQLIDKLGGSAPRPDECRQILNHGEAEVARAGSDGEIMQTLQSMRGELSAVYDKAIDSPRLDATQRVSLAQLAPQ